MLRHVFGLFFCLGFADVIQSRHIVSSVEDCFLSSAPRVFLTVSSLPASATSQGVVRRRLEVNWVGAPPSPGDRVCVFDREPEKGAAPVLSVSPSEHPGGCFRSDIELPVQVPDLSVSTSCLGYWATYQNEVGSVEARTCLRVHPRWMWESAEQVSHLRLSELMLPGSHDSGSFFPRREREPFSRYKYAQELSVFNQLVHGLRYFDLRVGCYGGEFYINHNFLRTEHTVAGVLKQVQKFLTLSPKEIIILDFHNFPHGFHSEQAHLRLQHLIASLLGAFLIPYTDRFREATLKDLWVHEKNVLVSYDSRTRTLLYPDSFWPSIPRAWGNKQTAEGLEDYFRDFFQGPTPQGLWASMAEITPNTRSILLHPESGLRALAEQVNKNVTRWFRDLYWQKANIVATDYFLGNDIIDVAIRTNRIKGVCPESSWSNIKP